MREPGFAIKFFLLAIAQVVLWNFFNFTQYVMIAFMPVMILCLPIRRGSIYAMILAFIAGFAVDFFSSGMLGLTSLSLVPVAFARRGVIQLICGEEVFSRAENISIQRQGLPKMTLAIFIVTAIFLAVYIWADGAGTRPLWFNLVKFGASLAASTLVSIFMANLLEPDNR